MPPSVHAARIPAIHATHQPHALGAITAATAAAAAAFSAAAAAISPPPSPRLAPHSWAGWPGGGRAPSLALSEAAAAPAGKVTWLGAGI